MKRLLSQLMNIGGENKQRRLLFTRTCGTKCRWKCIWTQDVYGEESWGSLKMKQWPVIILALNRSRSWKIFIKSFIHKLHSDESDNVNLSDSNATILYSTGFTNEQNCSIQCDSCRKNELNHFYKRSHWLLEIGFIQCNNCLRNHKLTTFCWFFMNETHYLLD